MKQELAVVKKKRGMDGGEEKGKHFFFVVFVVMRHCKRQNDRQCKRAKEVSCWERNKNDKG